MYEMNLETASHFMRWLVSKRGQSHPIGDLAHDVYFDESAPIDGDWLDLMHYLTVTEHLDSHAPAIIALVEAQKMYEDEQDPT